jgi:hypothetical protein
MTSLPRVLLLSASLAAAEPLLVIVLEGGLKVETGLGRVRKLTFTDTAFTVHARDGRTDDFPLAGVGRIHFAFAATAARPAPMSRDRGLVLEPDGSGGAWLSLPEPARVEAALYDLAGRRARALGSTSLAAGRHRVSPAGGTGSAPPDPDALHVLRILQVRVEGHAPLHVLLTGTPPDAGQQSRPPRGTRP